jgi:hypothetical protein
MPQLAAVILFLSTIIVDGGTVDVPAGAVTPTPSPSKDFQCPAAGRWGAAIWGVSVFGDAGARFDQDGVLIHAGESNADALAAQETKLGSALSQCTVVSQSAGNLGDARLSAALAGGMLLDAARIRAANGNSSAARSLLQTSERYMSAPGLFSDQYGNPTAVTFNLLRAQSAQTRLDQGWSWSSGPVAMLTAQAGLHCHDSISGLGENVPPNTRDKNHAVVRISTITLTNQAKGVSITGYLYILANKQTWLGASPSYRGDYWTNLAKALPFLGPFVQTYADSVSTAYDAISAQQLASLVREGPKYEPGAVVELTPCFKGSITAMRAPSLANVGTWR